MPAIWFTDKTYIDTDNELFFYEDENKWGVIPDWNIRKLLDYFANNPYKRTDKNSLMNIIWPNGSSNYDYNNFYQEIKKTRNFIRDNDNSNFFIINDNNGYYYLHSVNKEPPEYPDYIKLKRTLKAFNKPANIYMASKKEIESYSGNYSIDERCKGARRIVQVCYANTAFLANNIISRIYDPNWRAKYRDLLSQTKIDLVLMDPRSPQMAEMINYKLRPRVSGANIDRTNPFQANISDILQIMEDIRNEKIVGSDFNVYFAPFSMSNSYFRCVFPEEEIDKETIKIDLYTPIFSTYQQDELNNWFIPEDQVADENRASFIVDRKNTELYEFFANNIEDIISHSTPVIVHSVFQGSWKARLISYGTGNFKRSFNYTDINKGLGV